MLIPVGISKNIFTTFSATAQDHIKQLISSTISQNKNIIKESITETGIKSRTGNLLDSIEIIDGHQFEDYIEIGVEYAEYLNDGYGPYNMRPGLLNGPKSRMSIDGFRYNRIPINGHLVTISERSQKKATGQRDVKGRFMKTWTHPGIKGYKFAENIQKNMNRVIVSSIVEYIMNMKEE